MGEKTTQEQRLDYLVEKFHDEYAGRTNSMNAEKKIDSGEDKALQMPGDTDGKRRILRSLMNIRMPHRLPDDVLKVQDEYLTERAEEKGIVSVSDIPEIKDGISIWQGDITRIAADAIVNAANSQMLGCFVPMHTCIDNPIPLQITHKYLSSSRAST